jgi:hypothetical protein
VNARRGTVRSTRMRALILLVATMMTATVLAATGTASSAASPGSREPVVTELTSFAASDCASGCGSGSTIGPDGALYVTDGPGGRVLRVDRWTGRTTTYAEGLPQAIPAVGIGGAMDVAFVGRTAYVLVTMVGSDFGQPDVVAGIYRIARHRPSSGHGKHDGDRGEPRAIADIGAWSIANPPETDFFVDGGVQYALEEFRGDLVVTDGHHNRVLRVTRSGHISELRTFGNVVPTGLEIVGGTILMAQAGPIPHDPEDGRIVRFSRHSAVVEVASGASLAVDVAVHRHRLYALSQGSWDLDPIPENEGMPASPDTGALLRLQRDGSFATVVGELDRPTSLEFTRKTAFVVTLTGKVLRIDGVTHRAGPRS